MRSTFAIPLLVTAALLLPIGAYAAGQQQPDASATTADQTPSPDSTAAANAGQSSSMAQDQSIAAKIKSEMAAQNVASLPAISVEADSSGAVVLSGTAQSQEDVDKTMSIARGTTGVTSVRNDVKVKPQG